MISNHSIIKHFEDWKFVRRFNKSFTNTMWTSSTSRSSLSSFNIYNSNTGARQIKLSTTRFTQTCPDIRFRNLTLNLS